MPGGYAIVAVLALSPVLCGGHGGKAAYVGGTGAEIREGAGGALITSDLHALVFRAGRSELRVPYSRVTQIEYGQKVDRRYLTAVLISPMFLLSKSRKHFLTIHYSDGGRPEAAVFQVSKGDIRTVLVSLEARTGLKVHYQDEEARKAGKG